MGKGSLRKEITDVCPEEFKDLLIDFIDKVEGRIVDIADKLKINSVSDIGNIEDAFILAKELADEFY